MCLIKERQIKVRTSLRQMPNTLLPVRDSFEDMSWTRRQKRASLALASLIVTTFSLVLITYSTTSSLATLNYPAPIPRLKDESLGTSHSHRNMGQTKIPKPSLVLSAHEELAAVIHFLTALTSNAITRIDPTHPVPAELLLDFDTRSGNRALSELENVVQSTWFENPVVLFSEVRLSYTL